MNAISTNTPGGSTGRCPLCGATVVVSPSAPLRDAPCPACGALLWPLAGEQSLYLFVADQLSQKQKDFLTAMSRKLKAGGVDSLDRVELVMELEEMFETSIPDELADQWRTVDDFLKWWLEGGSNLNKV